MLINKLLGGVYAKIVDKGIEVIPRSDMRRQYDEGFKKNVVKLCYAGNKSVTQVSNDLGISTHALLCTKGDDVPRKDRPVWLKVVMLGNAYKAAGVKHRACTRSSIRSQGIYTLAASRSR